MKVQSVAVHYCPSSRRADFLFGCTSLGGRINSVFLFVWRGGEGPSAQLHVTPVFFPRVSKSIISHERACKAAQDQWHFTT